MPALGWRVERIDMLKKLVIAGLLAVSLATLPLPAYAANKTYQVTGPVLEVSDTKIVVQKGKEKWEIGRDAATKVTGDVKVGATVTVEYTMTAATITAKAEKAPAKKKK